MFRWYSIFMFHMKHLNQLTLNEQFEENHNDQMFHVKHKKTVSSNINRRNIETEKGNVPRETKSKYTFHVERRNIWNMCFTWNTEKSVHII